MLYELNKESLKNFTPWSGAIETWQIILENEKLDDFIYFLKEFLQSEQIEEGRLNDFLWFDDLCLLKELKIFILDEDEIEKVSDLLEEEIKKETFHEDEILDLVSPEDINDMFSMDGVFMGRADGIAIVRRKEGEYIIVEELDVYSPLYELTTAELIAVVEKLNELL